jgi:hypothetical protein
MNFFKANAVALVAVVIAIGAYFYPAAPVVKSGAIIGTSYFDVFDASTSYKLRGTTIVNYNSGATSTIAIGNVTTTATSSATAICMQPSLLGATSTFNGTVYWKYGACPF